MWIPIKTGRIEDEDVEFAEEVLRLCPGSFLGGSYVALGRAAGDIDVVIPHAQWKDLRRALSGRIKKVRAEFPTEQEDTSDMPDDDRLVTVYRRGNVDLLVIHDGFVRSYEQAVHDIKSDPERFSTREARVAIHIHYADLHRAELGLPFESEIIAARRRKGQFGGSGDYT